VVAEERPGTPKTLEFHADSDAQIVRGLIAVLLAAFSGRTPEEIQKFPIEELFAELKLPALVPMRSNGLYSMVRRIQSLAREAAESQPAEKTQAAPLPVVPFKVRSGETTENGNGHPRKAKPPLLPVTVVTGQPLAA